MLRFRKFTEENDAKVVNLLKSFIEDHYLSEMTIVNRSSEDYPVGTKLKLSKNPNKTILAALKAAKFNTAAKSIELSDTYDSVVGQGDFSINVKFGRKAARISGTESALNSLFSKAGGGGKSDTNKLTRVKEACSLLLFKFWADNGGILSKENTILALSSVGADQVFMKDKYYDSAVKQLGLFKRLRQFKSGSYIFEFQGDKYSSLIYKAANKLGKGGPVDNWNPGDLWIFNRNFINDIKPQLDAMISLAELNMWVRRQFLTGNVVSVSLKASGEKAHMEIVDPIKYKNKTLDYDFTLKRILIAESLKSCFIETASGYQLKANARSSENNPTLYFEGTFKKENFSMGAIDKRDWVAYHKGAVLNGKKFKFTNKDLKHSKKIFKQYANLIPRSEHLTTPDFSKFTETKKRRYVSVASLVEFVMSDYNNIIKWSFFSAMKVSDTNSMYVKIK